MRNVINQVFFGNTILAYSLVVLGIIITWIIWKLARRLIISLLTKLTSKTKTNFDDLLIEATDKFLGPYTYLAVNYAIILQLELSENVSKVLKVAALLVTTYYAVRLVNFVIQHLIVVGMKSRNESEQRIQQVQGMLTVVKAIVWASGLVMLMDNLGYNVTTIIAGLGVGGIAIALAAQSILTDLFSYIVIFFDKPFEIGDFIVTSGYSGVVEKIGIKTSHVRSLDGQQLIMPNTEMVKSVIQNFKRLEKRRIVFNIGVVYNTPVEKLRLIPRLIKEIIEKQATVTFDRANFKSFGDFSINYEIAYYIGSPDYVFYMNTQEKICLNIFESFQQRNIDFAFPTQTIFLSDNSPVADRKLFA
ncbi:MAG: mechanosensitive ion channel family protein [Bacteroidetes bacterium]|nr:mechanosensitive ion channel family protein [Bacteroidota bacterium]